MAAHSLNVWKIWRQDHGTRGQRLFWFVESPHANMYEFMRELVRNGYMRLDSLQTDPDSNHHGHLVVTGRREIMLTPSAVHFIELPLNTHFVEYS